MSQAGEASHPMCELCKGACCEAVTLDISAYAQSSDFLRFLEFRSLPQVREMDGKPATNFRLFEAKCLMLQDGRCAVYGQRPKMCEGFAPGSQNCITTVAARRPPDVVREILQCAESVLTVNEPDA